MRYGRSIGCILSRWTWAWAISNLNFAKSIVLMVVGNEEKSSLNSQRGVCSSKFQGEFEIVFSRDSLLRDHSFQTSRLLFFSFFTWHQQIFLTQPCLLELAPRWRCRRRTTYSVRRLLVRRISSRSELPLLGRLRRSGKKFRSYMFTLSVQGQISGELFLLRGNHGCTLIRIYGFYGECKRQYNIKLWRVFCDVFNCLPFAAIVDEKIFLSTRTIAGVEGLTTIMQIKRPTVFQTWAYLRFFMVRSRSGYHGWGENDRGVGYTYGTDVVAVFGEIWLWFSCSFKGCQNGYEFFGNGGSLRSFGSKLLREFDNAGAMMTVDENLMCSFQILKPAGENIGGFTRWWVVGLRHRLEEGWSTTQKNE